MGHSCILPMKRDSQTLTTAHPAVIPTSPPRIPFTWKKDLVTNNADWFWARLVHSCTTFLCCLDPYRNPNMNNKDHRVRYQGCTPRPGPAPGEMAALGRPGPENFQLCPAPPRPVPPRKKRALPRPAPPRKLPRGKNRGKRSYIIKSFWESKTFDQYF